MRAKASRSLAIRLLGVVAVTAIVSGCDVGSTVAPIPSPAERLYGTWTWDGNAWVQEAGPEGDTNGGLVFDGNTGKLLRVASTAGGTTIAKWDGTSWVPLKLDTLQLVHTQASNNVVYDTVRHRVVVFSDGIIWEWDGISWRQATRDLAPVPTVVSAVAYDEARNATVAFGVWPGVDDTSTWTWDGTNWTKRNPVHSPPAREHAAMTFDVASRTVLLFGGDKLPYDILADTWSWDGQDWTQLHPTTSPPARVTSVPFFCGAMASDPMAHQTVLVLCEQRAFVETWIWQGGTWQKHEPKSSPPSPTAAGSSEEPEMAYDASTGKVTMFIPPALPYVAPLPFPGI